MAGFGIEARFLNRANRCVDAGEIFADSFAGKLVAAGLGLGQVVITDAENDFLGRDLLIGGAKAARLASTAFDFTALVEKELDVSARGEVGDHVEFEPEL